MYIYIYNYKMLKKIQILKLFLNYSQVKVVNYIKRQIYLQKCVFCEMKVDNILEHMKKENHFKIPSPKTWDQPELVLYIKI